MTKLFDKVNAFEVVKTVREELAKLEQSKPYLDGEQWAVNQAVELRQSLKNLWR